MDKIIPFEDLKTKIKDSKTKQKNKIELEKLELEKKIVELAKEFVDSISDLVILENDIKECYQIFNIVFENQVRVKKLMEECGLNADLSIRITYNSKIDE